MAQAIDEAVGDLALADTGIFFLGRLQIVGMHQPGQRVLHELFQRPAEGILPDRVERDRHHVQAGDRQQVTGQLPGAVTFAGALLHALAQGFVHLPEGLGRQLLFGDVHHHADEARALLAFEERLAAGFHPTQAAVIEEHAIGGAEFTTVFTGDGTGDFLAYPLAVLRVAEAFEQRHVHRVLCADAEHGPATLVPDQRAALRFVIPHAQACRIDGQACAYLDLAQSLLGLQAAASFVDFGQCPFHCLG